MAEPIVVRTLPPAWGLPVTPNLAGIYIGGCVSALPFGSARAHSHCRRKGLEPWGWICMRFHHTATDANGGPSEMLKHELAHILTDESHTLAWATALEAMGGQVHRFYGYTPYFSTAPKTPASKRGVLGSLKEIGKRR